MIDKKQENPLVTFALFAYNQQKYVREAIEGAFAQTYSPMEIILSDDCSKDRTFEIMEEMADNYEGPHRVHARRNSINLGVAKHFDLLIRAANGAIFVAAAGDDISEKDRTEVSVRAVQENRGVGLVEVRCLNFSTDFSRFHWPNENPGSGVDAQVRFSLVDILDGKSARLIGAGRAYIPETYVEFPEFIEGCPEEDTPALFRCLHYGFGIYVKRSLVARRLHAKNLSNPMNLSKVNFPILKRQYIKDLMFARDVGRISESEARFLEPKICKYSFRKQCSVDALTGFRGSISFFQVVRSGHFRPSEKLRLLRKGLVARLSRYD